MQLGPGLRARSPPNASERELALGTRELVPSPRALSYHPAPMEQATSPAVSVVLPTYNESETLPVIVPRIVETLRGSGFSCEVVIVDDDSPDGSAEVAERLSHDYPVRVIRRKDERGLATAVLTGFAQALAPVCIVMDADGSHPVSVLPAMARMITDDKADIVVGSRNIEGGGSHNWPLFSQLKSKLAASLSFGLTSMTDPTTGLMAVRKSLLPGLKLDPVGWKIVLEIAVKAAPARVAEVPIMFEDRELGESKQSLRVFAQYVLHVAKLYAFRYPALFELLKFCAVGVIGLCVDLGTVMAVKERYGLDTRVCAVFGFSVAVTTNYLLNRYYTFAKGRELPFLFSYLTYVGANLLGLGVRMAVVETLMVVAQLDRGHGYLLSNAAGIALATLFNFAGAKYFAFDPERLAFGQKARPEVDEALEPLPARIRKLAWLLLGAGALYALWAARAQPQLALWSWATIAFSGLLLWDQSQRAALYTALLLAGSPAFLSQSRRAPGEMPLIALSAAGLYLATKGARARRLALCFAGGALLGLGSLSRLWVTIPYALGTCGFVLVQTTLARAREQQPLALRRSVLAGLLGFASAAAAHPLLGTLLPQSGLPPWLGPIGLDSLSGRGDGEPLWFYPAVLYREHFYLLPLILLGLPALLRRTRVHAVVALAMAFGACIGVIVLSVPRAKDPTHVLSVVPFLYLLAGASLAELETDAPKYRPANRATVQAVSAVTLLSVVAVWLACLVGSTSLRFALLYSAGMVAAVSVGGLWVARQKLVLPLLAGCALAFILFAAGC